jgi:hypothetical protein
VWVELSTATSSLVITVAARHSAISVAISDHPPETATDETIFIQACPAPTVSAILAPRLPSGFGCPVVLSRTV